MRAAQRPRGSDLRTQGIPSVGDRSSKGHPNARLGRGLEDTGSRGLGSRTPQAGWGRLGEGAPGLRTCPQGSPRPALSAHGQPSARGHRHVPPTPQPSQSPSRTCPPSCPRCSCLGAGLAFLPRPTQHTGLHTAHLCPTPRELPLTLGSSVQQGPLSRPEVRAPRACGVALKPACDLGQVLEAQPLAWDVGAQEKTPVLSSERSGTQPGQACGRGHPRLLAQTGPGYGGCGVQPLRPPRPSCWQLQSRPP